MRNDPDQSGDGSSGEGALAVAVPPAPAGRDAAQAAPPSGDRGPAARMTYNPALDGIRGLAVAAVLLFHGGYRWAEGGYLGVSTFFTLSGFVVTTLLLTEHRARGGIDLARFWSRRARRLLPASAVVLAGIMVAGVLWDAAWKRALPGDLVASLLQVANWRFLLEDRDYGALFESPSPVLHFWSLSIEAQFYLVFPLVVAGVLRLSRGSLRAVAAVVAGLVGVAGVTTLALTDHSAIYYASPVRMGEILAGSLVAVAVFSGRGARAMGRPPVARAVGLAGAAALGVSVWAWWQVEQTSPQLDRGGFLVYAGVSGVLVLAACAEGPLKRALSVEPLRALGVVSYGVYLIHWPVFLLLTGERAARVLEPLGMAPRGTQLFVLKLVVTLGLAAASYRLVEKPIRTGRWPRPPATPVLAVGTVAAVVLAAVAIGRYWPAPEDDFAQQEEAEPVLVDVDGLAPDAAVGVAFGDSTVFRTGWGLNDWGDSTGRMVVTDMVGGMGCGLGRGGQREYLGERGDIPPECEQWDTDLGEKVEEARENYGDLVGFALVQFGPWDVADRRLEGDDRWRHIGDPVYDEYLRGEIAAAMDLMREEGLAGVWLTSPTIELGKDQVPPPPEPYPESDPARMEGLNRMVEDLAAERPWVVTVDLAGWIESLPPGEDDRLRPDGVHFDTEASLEVAEEWLGEAILDAAAEGRRGI